MGMILSPTRSARVPVFPVLPLLARFRGTLPGPPTAAWLSSGAGFKIAARDFDLWSSGALTSPMNSPSALAAWVRGRLLLSGP